MTQEFITLFLAWMVVLIIPGQDMALVLKTCMTHSRQQAMAVVHGIALALLIHIALVVTGMALLIQQSPIAYSLIEKAGAVYIGYLGVTWVVAFFNNQETNFSDYTESANETKINRTKLVRMGFFSTILNPKVTLFFFGLLVGIVDMTSPMKVFLVYGSMISGMTFLFYKMLTTTIVRKEFHLFFMKNTRYVEMVSGTLFVAISFSVLFLKSSI